MLQRISLVLSVCAIALFLGRGLSQAGWSGLGLTTAHDASSLVISVKKKKKKHHDDDDNADNNDNGPETPKVDQASCAKEGLQYVAGAGDKCYCPNGLVNKATGLLVATHRSDCVTAKSYNQLDSSGKGICCKAVAIDRDNQNRTVLPAGCGATQAEAENELKSHASINNWDIQGSISCAPR